jgi:hypothetical protein
LLLRQELPLACHEILLFLLASLKVVLLLCGQSSSEARESAGEWRLNDAGRRDSGSSSGGGKWSSLDCRRSMRNTDLRYKERFARIANASDELSKRFKLVILQLLD